MSRLNHLSQDFWVSAVRLVYVEMRGNLHDTGSIRNSNVVPQTVWSWVNAEQCGSEGHHQVLLSGAVCHCLCGRLEAVEIVSIVSACVEAWIAEPVGTELVAECITVSDGGEQSRIDLSQGISYFPETNTSVVRTLDLAVDHILKRSVVVRLDVPN